LRDRLDIVRVEVLKAHAHVREHRTLDVLAKALRLRRSIFRLRHDERLAAPSARHAFDQVTIHAAADAKGEHIGVAQVLLDQLECAAFLCDVAVGHQHYTARGVRRPRQREHTFQRSFELGPTAAVLIIDERERALEIIRRSGQRTLGEQATLAREQQHVEAVLWSQASCELSDQLLRSVERKALHRTGHV
jgi:hypothetical protein